MSAGKADGAPVERLIDQDPPLEGAPPLVNSVMPAVVSEIFPIAAAEAGAESGVLLPVTAGLVRGLDVDGCGDLRFFLAALPDPRDPRGRRYGYGPLVSLAAAAMLGGANSVAGIFRWGRDAPDAALSALGFAARRRTGQVGPPSLKTLRRLLKDLDGTALDAALAAWVSVQVAVGRIAPGQVALALDGKVLRGSKNADGTVHLFAALLHGEAVVTGQRAIPDKTGETKAFAPLLDTLDIAQLDPKR